MKDIAYYYLINKFADNFNEENFYEKHAHLKEFKNFTPRPLPTEGLDAETELKVKQAFLSQIKVNAPEITADYTVEDVKIRLFYGIYENCFTGSFYIKINGVIGEPYFADKVIGGVTFLSYWDSIIDVIKL